MSGILFFIFASCHPLNDDEIEVREQGSLTHGSLSDTIPKEENHSYIPDKYFYYQDYLKSD